MLHVAGGRVEPRDGGIRDTIRREFIEEVGAWPVDLTKRISNATLRNVARGYCLATIDVTERGFVVLSMAPGLTFENLQAKTEAKLHLPA